MQQSQQLILTPQQKFKIDNISSLSREQVMSMRAYQKAGEEHLKYFYATNNVFKHPELRVKCFDTLEFEELLPKVKKILMNFDLIASLPNEEENEIEEAV